MTTRAHGKITKVLYVSNLAKTVGIAMLEFLATVILIYGNVWKRLRINTNAQALFVIFNDTVVGFFIVVVVSRLAFLFYFKIEHFHNSRITIVIV